MELDEFNRHWHKCKVCGAEWNALLQQNCSNYLQHVAELNEHYTRPPNTLADRLRARALAAKERS